jgi:hypothetical protein
VWFIKNHEDVIVVTEPTACEQRDETVLKWKCNTRETVATFRDELDDVIRHPRKTQLLEVLGAMTVRN